MTDKKPSNGWLKDFGEFLGGLVALLIVGSIGFTLLFGKGDILQRLASLDLFFIRSETVESEADRRVSLGNYSVEFPGVPKLVTDREVVFSDTYTLVEGGTLYMFQVESATSSKKIIELTDFQQLAKEISIGNEKYNNGVISDSIYIDNQDVPGYEFTLAYTGKDAEQGDSKSRIRLLSKDDQLIKLLYVTTGGPLYFNEASYKKFFDSLKIQ